VSAGEEFVLAGIVEECENLPRVAAGWVLRGGERTDAVLNVENIAEFERALTVSVDGSGALGVIGVEHVSPGYKVYNSRGY
jgi:hypothetical protein